MRRDADEVVREVMQGVENFINRRSDYEIHQDKVLEEIAEIKELDEDDPRRVAEVERIKRKLIPLIQDKIY